MNDKVTLSVKEAAGILGVSVPTMYDLAHRDNFPSFRVGKRVIISTEGLLNWIKSQAGSDAFFN